MATRDFSKKQEKKVAKELGGKVVANSGATRFFKGDVNCNKFLIECKTKTKESSSINIKKEWLEKIKQEANISRKSYYALIFDFGDNNNYAIIDINLFKYIISLLENVDE